MSKKRASRSPITISDQTFPTKEAAKTYIQRLMKKYPDDSILDLPVFEFVFDLLRRHPSLPKKLGCGVAKFTVRRVPPWYRNRAFYIIRNDGTGTEFSFMECLSPRPHAIRFQNACRTAIADQIVEFVERSFALDECVQCAITGAPLTRKACHVDHDPPFRNLVRQFIETEKIVIDEVRIDGEADNVTTDYFGDSLLAKRFSAFHRDHAKLRLVTSAANLGRRRNTS